MVKPLRHSDSRPCTGRCLPCRAASRFKRITADIAGKHRLRTLIAVFFTAYKGRSVRASRHSTAQGGRQSRGSAGRCLTAAPPRNPRIAPRQSQRILAQLREDSRFFSARYRDLFMLPKMSVRLRSMTSSSSSITNTLSRSFKEIPGRSLPGKRLRRADFYIAWPLNFTASFA